MKKSRKTDGITHLTPDQLGERWAFHPETIRRKCRTGEIASVVIARRRLIPLVEILRIEKEGSLWGNSDGRSATLSAPIFAAASLKPRPAA
jgi:hypothetical protein